MRVIIDIGHPAHVHLFRFFASEMQEKGHEILFTYREKEHEKHLLEITGVKFISVGHHYSTTVSKIFGLVLSVLKMVSVFFRFRADLFLSHGSIIAAQASWLVGRPHISLEDTGNHEQVRLYRPFTSAILTSYYFRKNYGNKQVRYSSFHEMAYLRPRYFVIDQSFRDSLALGSNDKMIIVRFISWKATHDRGSIGLSDEEKTALIIELSKFGKVLISSEGKLPDSICKYKYPLSPETIHQALANADLFVGEGATMTSECCMLGTPAIYINPQLSGTIDEQIRRGLVFQFLNSEESLNKAREILSDHDSKRKFLQKREKLLKETTDLTRFLVWFIENWPDSYMTMKADPEFEKKFV